MVECIDLNQSAWTGLQPTAWQVRSRLSGCRVSGDGVVTPGVVLIVRLDGRRGVAWQPERTSSPHHLSYTRHPVTKLKQPIGKIQCEFVKSGRLRQIERRALTRGTV